MSYDTIYAEMATDEGSDAIKRTRFCISYNACISDSSEYSYVDQAKYTEFIREYIQENAYAAMLSEMTEESCTLTIPTSPFSNSVFKMKTSSLTKPNQYQDNIIPSLEESPKRAFADILALSPTLIKLDNPSPCSSIQSNTILILLDYKCNVDKSYPSSDGYTIVYELVSELYEYLTKILQMHGVKNKLTSHMACKSFVNIALIKKHELAKSITTYLRLPRALKAFETELAKHTIGE